MTISLETDKFTKPFEINSILCILLSVLFTKQLYDDLICSTKLLMDGFLLMN